MRVIERHRKQEAGELLPAATVYKLSSACFAVCACNYVFDPLEMQAEAALHLHVCVCLVAASSLLVPSRRWRT